MTFSEVFREFWRHASPRILVALLGLALGIRLFLGPASLWDALPIAGTLLYWPLNEWLIHVFVLHYKPLTLAGRTLDFPVPRSHRIHHRDPWNIDLLFIPLHSYIYSIPLLVGVWYLITPTAPLAWTGVSIYLVLSLHYEWVHYLAHTRYWPRSAYYRRVITNHRLHHFKNENYWQGVSMRAADRWFGTRPDPRVVETSPTASTLGVDVTSS